MNKQVIESARKFTQKYINKAEEGLSLESRVSFLVATMSMAEVIPTLKDKKALALFSEMTSEACKHAATLLEGSIPQVD